MLFLAAALLAGNQSGVASEVVLGPLTLERLGGSRRDDHHVGLARHRRERLPHEREGGDFSHNTLDRPVDRFTPLERQSQIRVARGPGLRPQRGVGKLRLPPDPVTQPGEAPAAVDAAVIPRAARPESRASRSGPEIGSFLRHFE